MACSCAWMLDIAWVYSILSSYLTFILPVILPYFHLTCHLTSLLSYLSSYLIFIFTWLLQVALGSPETAKRFSMKSGQQQYIDNLIRLFPQEEDAIKKYEKLILVSTSCGCEHSSVYCDLVLLQLCDHFHINTDNKWHNNRELNHLCNSPGMQVNTVNKSLYQGYILKTHKLLIWLPNGTHDTVWNRMRPRALVQNQQRMYLWWSLCTLHLHACHVRVTVGN